MKIIRINAKSKSVLSAKELVKAALKERLGESSASMAYSFLFGIIPIVIFIGCLVGRFELFSNTAELFLKSILPKGLFDALRDYLDSKSTALSGEATGALGLSLYWGVRISHSLKTRLNHLFGIERPQSPKNSILKTAVFSLMIPASTVITLFVLVCGEGFFAALESITGTTSFFIRMWLILRFVLVWLFLLAVFYLIYCYLPSRRIVPKNALRGALFSSFAWVLMCILFSFYVDNMRDLSLIYGSVGAVMVMLVWIYLTCYVLLLGGLITSIYENSEKN
ncbi:MAG: YihY/virulence factor BrkB family protein [Ruminococcaceae bacterium]|nr:YihY/virulence factor BrkB family protein [Oscillospiraceae bacterium]